MQNAQGDSLLVAREAGNSIARLTLNNPQNRNALSLGLLGALSDAFAAIARDGSIRCVILDANGPAFCAGHDLKELTATRASQSVDCQDHGAAFFKLTMARCSALMQAITALPQPVIAAVEGMASAAGCQLVATCDLAIAGEAARFCTPGVDIGLFCSTPAVALARNTPRKHAMEMLLTGEAIDAEAALRMGLVNTIVPRGGALAAALAMARTIASKPASTIARGKQTFYAQIDMPLAQAYDRASGAMALDLLADEAIEGIGAFIEKRKPDWRQT